MYVDVFGIHVCRCFYKRANSVACNTYVFLCVYIRRYSYKGANSVPRNKSRYKFSKVPYTSAKEPYISTTEIQCSSAEFRDF